MSNKFMLGIISSILFCLSSVAYAAPKIYEVSIINTIGIGDLADGLGSITWDSATQTMTQFEWDFLEGSEPGMAANWLTESWLTSSFGGGTYGSALWELITGEDVFPDSVTQVDALESAGALATSNGFPNLRAEFFPNAGYSFISSFSDEEIVAEGTMSVSPIPIPAAVWLFGSGLLGLVGIARRKKA
jgi:hypothetical protein